MTREIAVLCDRQLRAAKRHVIQSLGLAGPCVEGRRLQVLLSARQSHVPFAIDLPLEPGPAALRGAVGT